MDSSLPAEAALAGQPSTPARSTVILSCQVLQDLFAKLLPIGLARQVRFMDYGLHRVPAKMTRSLQEALHSIQEPGLVVLGYGLCGNGLHGLRANQHYLLVPRVDDCITLLLGSRRAYLREFESVPGTYYLSKGWLESGSHPLKEYEEYLPKYGAQQAMWLMDQQYRNYERLVLVAHSQADLEAYRPQALEVARFCARWGMRYEEILGSDTYVRRLVGLLGVCQPGEAICACAGCGSEAKVPSPSETEADSARWAELLRQAGHDFLVVPPGGEIRQEQFIR